MYTYEIADIYTILNQIYQKSHHAIALTLYHFLHWLIFKHLNYNITLEQTIPPGIHTLIEFLIRGMPYQS